MDARPVLVLLALVAAGCVSTPGATVPPVPEGPPRVALPHFDAALPAPLPLCHEGRCDFEMTPDEGRQGNEVTIAVNPLDPRNVVGGAKDYYPADAGECVWDGVYVTHDGARTPYEDRSFDGSPWRQLQSPDPSKLNYASQFWCTTDPVAYFDLTGNLYYVLMAYQADRVTGSKFCEDLCPGTPATQGGALNDWAFNRAAQIVAISSDGGDTFHTFTAVADGSFPVAFHDKAWIAAQNDGSAIHVLWLSFLAGGQMYFRSTDGGKTYTKVEQFATLVTGAGQGSFVDVGPGDEVYASWGADDGAMLVRSKDKGETWDAPRKVVDMVPTSIENGLSPRDRRNLGFPAMATDKFADSPFAGAVYFTWQDGRDQGDPSNVYFAASFDGGETFTEPLRLNDDATSAPQLMPAISVSPGGVIDVTWVDQRLDADGLLLLDQYYTYSLDGGRTWAPNVRVRDAQDEGWDPNLSHHQNGMVFIGDYVDIDSSWQAAHPVWPDTRSGEVVDVYTATLLRPMFAVGFPEDKRAAAEAWVAEHPV
ncbi:MAG TPA: sialidase family protein [Candidatus Thermoplasmatota archaeon]|nr:sialidase family protein [Candidatus Thermoplasmatota archaeon]